MFDISELKRAGALVWANSPELQAALRNDNAAWLRRVAKLEHCPRMDSSEVGMVRGLRDSITGGGRGTETGTSKAPTPLSKLSPMQIERLIAATPVPVYVPAASAPAAPSAPGVEAQSATKMAYETPEQTRARAAVAFNANSQAGAQIRRDFAGSLSTYQAYEVAMRHRRVKILSGGGVKTYRGVNHA